MAQSASCEPTIGATLAGLAAFAKPLPVPPIDPSARKRLQSASSPPPQRLIPTTMRTPGRSLRDAAREYAQERSLERERNCTRHDLRAAVLAPLRNNYVQPPAKVRPPTKVRPPAKVKPQSKLPRIAGQRRAIAGADAVETVASPAATRHGAAATLIQALARGQRGRQLTKEKRAKVVAGAEAFRTRAATPAAPTALAAAHWVDSERTQAAWTAANAQALVAARAPVSGVAGWTVDLLTTRSPTSATLVWTNGQWPTQGQPPR